MTTTNKTVAEMVKWTSPSVGVITRLRVSDAQRPVRAALYSGEEPSAEHIAELRAAWAACPEHGTAR